ncbi:hypothetical protein ACSBR1_019377 [Camellia fascicularis]
MLKLAELFFLAGIDVTFLNSEHNHCRLLRYTDVRSHFAPYVGFNFETIPNGLPVDHPRSRDRVMELFHSIRVVMKSQFREMISGHLNYEFKRPVTCIIVDGIMCFTIDVAEEIGIPIISFCTINDSCLWTFFNIPELIETGTLPLRGIMSSSICTKS